ncbi:hypothetical protein I8920_13100 [Curtobacterium sp. YC1]|uniref:hypothetical protein n=1 Tax=Curtobacterium sp. YC1 TaxID=2795488 RepID=UPI0018E4DDC8|nr:hypothetical protein [Curtobacterium sp. YC1]QQD75742.1 hypothetical protein I8920_13100 [Curtobacterium sp. YC1]
MHSNASASNIGTESGADCRSAPEATAPEARALLLAVQPQFAAMLMAGTKPIELRKRFPSQPRGTVVFVYASTPVKSVVGTMFLDQVESCAIDRVWRELIPLIGATEQYIRDYAADREEMTLLHLRSPRPFAAAIPLRDLRTHVGVEPPQSFRYLNPTAQAVMHRLAGP